MTMRGRPDGRQLQPKSPVGGRPHRTVGESWPAWTQVADSNHWRNVR